MSVRGQTLGTAEAETNADFVELAEDLEFAFMGHAEARTGRWGLLADGLYLKPSPEGQTGPVSLGALSSSGFNIETEIKSSILELGGFYRVGRWELTDRGAEGPQLSLEGLLGVRYTALDVEVRVTGSVSGYGFTRHSMAVVLVQPLNMLRWTAGVLCACRITAALKSVPLSAFRL